MPRRLKLRGYEHAAKASIVQPGKTKTDVSASIEQSHARQILNLPNDQRELVIASLQEGASPTNLAMFFGEQGWLDVTEKTFRQYITAFRRVYPELIRGQNPANIDALVSPRAVQLDEEAALDQLIRVQKVRLKRGMDFEARTNLPMKDLYKDIEVTARLIETKAGLRGKTGKGGTGAGKNSIPMTNEASEALRQSDNAESSQEKLMGLTAQLVPLLKKKALVGGKD